MASCSKRGRVRPRPVSFGNPALGTYEGCVYTLEEDESCPLPSLPAKATPIDKVVAMSNVPPEQVPEGILNLARSHRPFIEHLKITVSSEKKQPKTANSTLSSRLLPQEMSSLSLQDNTSQTPRNDSQVPPSPSASAMETAASILASDKDDNYDLTETRTRQDMLMTTDDDDRPSRTYVILFQLSTQEAADTFVRELDNVPYTSLDETQKCHVHHVVALQADDGVSLMSPFFAPSRL